MGRPAPRWQPPAAGPRRALGGWHARIPPGLADMMVASLLFALMGAMVKAVEATLPVSWAVFARSAIGLALSLWLVRRAGLSWRGNRPALLAVRGAIGFSALVCTFHSLSLLPLADAVVIQQTHPIWTAILARIFLKERAGGRVIAATAMALAGVVLVVKPAFLGFEHAGTGQAGGPTGIAALDPLGVGLALLGAVLSAGAYVSVRALRRTDDARVVVFWFAFVATPLSAVALGVDLATSAPHAWPGLGELGLLLGIGVAVQGAQLLMTRALHREPAGRVAAVGYLQVVYAFALGTVFFGESLGWISLAGTALIIGGALLAIRSRPGEAGPPTDPTVARASVQTTLDSAPRLG